MRGILEGCKNMTVLENTLSVKSSLKEEQLEALDALVDALAASMTAAEPAAEEAPKKGFVCKICGYVHEGDSLPEDFTCPLCKKGAEFFEPLA